MGSKKMKTPFLWVKCNIQDLKSFDDKFHTSRQKFSKSEMEMNSENQ